MAALELTQEHCESIRKVIDIRLDEITLPDPTILLDIYAGTAVNRVIGRMGSVYEETDAEQAAKLIPAAIFACAALIIPAIKQISLERNAGAEKRFAPMDWEKKIAELDARTDEILDQILIVGRNHTAFMPTIFKTAKAHRRGSCGF